MNRIGKYLHRKQIVSLLLALALALTCIPLGAFAQDGPEGDGIEVCNASEPVKRENRLYSDLNEEQAVDPVTGKPSLPKADTALQPFQVYATYLDIAPINLVPVLYANGVSYFYVELSSDGGASWRRIQSQYGRPFSYTGSQASIGNLTPNTVYLLRLRSSNISGSIGSVFYQITIHTGMPDIQVKSVKLKAVKVKKHRERARTPYLGLPLSWHWVYYTYKLKVTVKLKSAPGTPGIFINGEWVPGNKKSYSVTFPSTLVWNSKKSPKGRARLTVGVYSGFDPSYGGYSPLWMKQLKAK